MFGTFIQDKNYNEIVNERIAELVSTGKYILAEALLTKFIEKLEERRLNEEEHLSVDDYLEL